MLQNKNNASGKLFKREAAKESLLKRQFQKIAQSPAIMYTQKQILPHISRLSCRFFKILL